MTISRPEIVIEGSNDGQNWVAYAFKYKPGDVVEVTILRDGAEETLKIKSAAQKSEAE